MPGEPTAEPRLEPPFLEVDIVVCDEEKLGGRLEEANRRADRPARLVHVRLGLEQGEAPLVDTHFGQLSRELAAIRAPMPASQLVRDHPADVVTGSCVLATRVPETCHEQVERRGGLAPTGKTHELALCGTRFALGA